MLPASVRCSVQLDTEAYSKQDAQNKWSTLQSWTTVTGDDITIREIQNYISMTGYNMMAPDSTADNPPRIYGEAETGTLLGHNLKVEGVVAAQRIL